VTHWELSDVSGPLLTYFMLKRDQQLQDSAEALQQAKLTLIHEIPNQVKDHKTFYTHPYAWAPFVLIGEGTGGAAASS
jgi:CHAT domain-containing protein